MGSVVRSLRRMPAPRCIARGRVAPDHEVSVLRPIVGEFDDLSQDSVKLVCRRSELQTVPGVTTQQSPNRSAKCQIVEAVRSLILTGTAKVDRRVGIDAIMYTSSLTVRQIGAVNGYVEDADQARAITLSAVAAAHSYATPAEVGAAGLLAEAVRSGDDQVIAAVLGRCRATFTDHELITGGVALLVGLIEHVAMLADLDVITVMELSVADSRTRSDRCVRAIVATGVARQTVMSGDGVRPSVLVGCRPNRPVNVRALPRRELLA